MIKQDELSDVHSCLNKAAVDEPLFVLRAQDATSPELVRMWAESARSIGVRDEKIQEALKTADDMEAWPHRRLPD